MLAALPKFVLDGGAGYERRLALYSNSVRLKLLASRAPRVGGLRARAGT